MQIRRNDLGDHRIELDGEPGGKEALGEAAASPPSRSPLVAAETPSGEHCVRNPEDAGRPHQDVGVPWHAVGGDVVEPVAAAVPGKVDCDNAVVRTDQAVDLGAERRARPRVALDEDDGMSRPSTLPVRKLESVEVEGR